MYDEDLAFVHAAGFSALAQAAAREIGGRLPPRSTVVDLGCGDGSLSLWLADRGHRVHGIDASRAMLDLARRRVPDGHFVHDDALRAPIPACAGVAAVGEIFSYAARAPDDVLPAWQRIRDALEPGGVFVFDVASRGRAPEPTHATRGGPGWRVEARAEEHGQMLRRTIDTWRTVDGAERHAREVHDLLLFDPHWVEAALTRLGLRVEHLGAYDDFALQAGWDALAAVRPER